VNLTKQALSPGPEGSEMLKMQMISPRARFTLCTATARYYSYLYIRTLLRIGPGLCRIWGTNFENSSFFMQSSVNKGKKKGRGFDTPALFTAVFGALTAHLRRGGYRPVRRRVVDRARRTVPQRVGLSGLRLCSLAIGAIYGALDYPRSELGRR
jgi:hypothetical protein